VVTEIVCEFLESTRKNYKWDTCSVVKSVVGTQLEATMIRAFVQPSTPPYQPLSSHSSEETERKFKGKVVHEAQLNCFYISPGGKKPKEEWRKRQVR
jgi:hypothetical protein